VEVIIHCAEGYSAHRHEIPTWEDPNLTFSNLRCYLAAFYAACGGIIETLTTLDTHSALVIMFFDVVGVCIN